MFGWFSTSSNADRGARLVPITPGRLLDTREGAATPLGRAGSVEVQVRGADARPPVRCSVAGSDVVGVVLNVTGINQQADSTGTFLSVVPELTAGVPPSTSNVNLSRGQIKPNMVIVPVGADGKIRLYNHAGSAHVAVDVVGYLTTTAPGAAPVASCRSPRRTACSTPARRSSGAVALGPGQAEDWSFADFVNSVRIDGECGRRADRGRSATSPPRSSSGSTPPVAVEQLPHGVPERPAARRTRRT